MRGDTRTDPQRIYLPFGMYITDRYGIRNLLPFVYDGSR